MPHRHCTIPPNEYFEISKVTIVDECDHANTEFKKKFGGMISLRKTLLTKAK
jgi:hypothetical protein